MTFARLRLWTLLGALGASGFLTSGPARAAPPTTAHPRIWLNPALLTKLKTKALEDDGDWRTVKRDADRLLSMRVPKFTVIRATNSNPVQFTLEERVPWEGAIPVFIGGGGGGWAPVNSPADRPAAAMATRTGVHTFTVPVDSREFGQFEGQRLVLFFSEGGYSLFGYQGGDWQSMLQTLGLVYRVTDDRAYADKGVELLDYITSLGAARMIAPEAIDSGFPSRSTIYALGIGFDWLYERLSASEKRQAVTALNYWYDWFVRAAYSNEGPGYSNYFGGHVLGFGIAGFATEADNPRGKEIVAHIRGLFDREVGPAFAAGGFAGGFPVEAYVYGTNHFQRLLGYALGVKTATGEDLLSSAIDARAVARSLLYNLKPNRWQVTDEGDYAGDYTGILQTALPTFLSYLLAGTKEGTWMQYLLQNLRPAPAGGRVEDAFTPLMFHDSKRPAGDYRLELPTWYHSRGDEHLYWRSSWKDDAVWASFMGGAAIWGDHQTRAAGHVSLQRGDDYLLVNSGQWKGHEGYGGSPQAFDSRSWRTNTLFLDDHGDYLFTGANYVGGQGSWGRNQVIAAGGSADYAYMKADLTTAYTIGDRKPFASRSLRLFQRSFVALGNGTVVLFDRLQFSKPGFVAKFYFHLNPAGSLPIIEGKSARYLVGQSLLFIHSLLPEVPTMQLANDPLSDEDGQSITRRIEISDSTSRKDLTALTLLTALPSQTHGMAAPVAIHSARDAMIGAMSLDRDARVVVLFAADATPQTHVEYDAPYLGGPQALDGPQGEHVITDLVPGRSYELSRNGAPLDRVTASSAGVVEFRSGAGGRFELRLSAQAAGRTFARRSIVCDTSASTGLARPHRTTSSVCSRISRSNIGR